MQLMQQSTSAHAPSNSSSGNDNGTADDRKLAVYVGDSPSDFAPLLRADLGIVVGQNKLLRRVAKAQGVKLKPLTAGQHACVDQDVNHHYDSDSNSGFYCKDVLLSPQ